MLNMNYGLRRLQYIIKVIYFTSTDYLSLKEKNIQNEIPFFDLHVLW